MSKAVRVPDATYERIKAAARRDRRSIAREIEVLVEWALAEQARRAGQG